LQKDIDRGILKVLSSSNTAPDEDEAFFISVIPAVRRMSEEEKLDFRMSVLQLIKNINNRRKERHVFEQYFLLLVLQHPELQPHFLLLVQLWTLTNSTTTLITS